MRIAALPLPAGSNEECKMCFLNLEALAGLPRETRGTPGLIPFGLRGSSPLETVPMNYLSATIREFAMAALRS
jgi:hypothetical protein